MKHKVLSDALQGIDPRLIEEAMANPKFREDCSPERSKNMGKFENRAHRISARRLVGTVLAACLVFALAISAYAANLFGMREMFRSENRELPEAAETYIQNQGEAASMEELQAEVTQSLCDDSRLLVTLELHGKEDYFLLEQSVDPQDLVQNIGLEGNGSVEEYAQSMGKQLLHVGVILKGDNMIGVQSTKFQYHGDGSMTALVEAGLNGEISEAACLITAVVPGGNVEDVKRMEIPVSISGAPVADDGEFVPDMPDAIAGMTVGNATVTESPMGLTIRWQVEIPENGELDVRNVELVGLDYGEGGMVLEDNGNWYFTASGIRGKLEASFTACFYDGDGGLLGQIQFQNGVFEGFR